MTNLEFENFENQEEVRDEIQLCSDKSHIQQVAYSTYHDALTQICFTCRKIRTTMSEEEALE